MAVRPGKNGGWVADFYTGKKKNIKTGFPRKKDATAYIEKRQTDFKNAQSSQNQRFETLTFSEIAEFFVSKHLSGGRASDNVSYIKNIVDRFGDYVLSKISPADVRDWIEELKTTPRKKTNSPYEISTIEKHLTYFKRVFNYAIERELISVNPIKGVKFVKLFKKKTKRNKHFSQEEFNHLDSLFVNTKWYASGVITILWHTGMRIGEVRNLKWCEVDIVRGIIVLDADRVKEGKIRTIGLEKEAIDLLVNLKQKNSRKGANSKDHVFGITGEKPLSYQTIYKIFRSIVKSTEFSEFNIHDIRHSYAIRKRREGWDKEVIKVQMGHVTDSMWNWYNDVAADEVAAMSGHNKKQRDIIDQDVRDLIEKMKKENISLNTIHTAIRENLN